jgi:serine/threonine protein kinase
LGYARVLEAQDLAITQIGTPLYMAPEILERQPYNSKVDFWSMGLIFYKMIYGKLPWKFTSPNHGAMINTI